MKVKIIYVFDKSKEPELEEQVNDFLSKIDNKSIYKIEHFCFGSYGWQTVAIYYSEKI